VTFARELAKAKTFMIEFTPFQEGARSISFDVSNLATKLQRISQACDWAGVDESRARAKAASDESRARANAASAALRARLAQYVHACAEMIGKWCWSDPADNLFHSDHGFAETREKALDEAVEYARMGLIGAVPTAVLPPLPPPPPKAVPTAVLPPLPPPPPPPKEEATPLRIRVGGNEQQAKLIRQPHPVYPPLAKQARIQGVVKLSAIIAKDGTIQHLEVVSGHPSLIQSALEAVKQWVYQPTLLNGEPVEVVTQIDVNFTVSQ
jgi:TonB family protein